MEVVRAFLVSHVGTLAAADLIGLLGQHARAIPDLARGPSPDTRWRQLIGPLQVLRRAAYLRVDPVTSLTTGLAHKLLIRGFTPQKPRKHQNCIHLGSVVSAEGSGSLTSL